MSDKCLIYDCKNRKSEGRFLGDLCAPCAGTPFKAVSAECDEMRRQLEAQKDDSRNLADQVNRLREALKTIRDFIPHPSHCDPIHNAVNEALKSIPAPGGSK